MKDFVPATGEAFLQHSTKLGPGRQDPFPVHHRRQISSSSMIQTTFGGNLGGDGLPADAMKLFDEQLCQVKLASEKMSPKVEDIAKDKGGQPDNAAINLDGPGHDDRVEDADADKKVRNAGLGRLVDASSEAHENGADSDFSIEADGNIQDKDDDKHNDTQRDNAVDKVEDSTQKTDKDEGNDEKIEINSESVANDKVGHSQKASRETHMEVDFESLVQTPPQDSKSGLQQGESLFSKWDSEDLDSTQAPLDEHGFEQVRKLKSESEMAMYIRRVADSCSLKVIDEGGLNGEVSWFLNSTGDDVTFERVKVGMFKALLAASKDHWVSLKKSQLEGITAENAPLNLLGYVQIRALRQKKEMIRFVHRMVGDMGIKITDPEMFQGFMAYYSEPDDSQSFARLMAELKKAPYENKWAELE